MKLPLTFSFASFLRLILPGAILSGALFPLISKIPGVWQNHDLTIFHAFLTIGLGWFIVVLDMHIYMFFEGRRYWPNCLWRFCTKREKHRLKIIKEKCDAALKKYRENSDLISRKIYLEKSLELRRFPTVEDPTVEEEYQAEWPTRIGYLLHAYESYSDRIYGLDSAFFWPRLWLLLPDDLRKEIDGLQAQADSAVYVSFCLYLSSIIFIGYSLAALGDILFAELKSWIWLVASGLSLVSGYFVYRISMHLHSQFGEYWKSVFDTHRNKLNIDIGVAIKEWDGEEKLLRYKSEKQRNKIIWRFLHNYKIKDDVSGEALKPGKYFALHASRKKD